MRHKGGQFALPEPFHRVELDAPDRGAVPVVVGDLQGHRVAADSLLQAAPHHRRIGFRKGLDGHHLHAIFSGAGDDGVIVIVDDGIRLQQVLVGSGHCPSRGSSIIAGEMVTLRRSFGMYIQSRWPSRRNSVPRSLRGLSTSER